MTSLSCRPIECFRPYHFGAVGYPFAINSIVELWKYTECMHDGFGIEGPLDRFILANFLQDGFTEEEFSHIAAIKVAIDDLGATIGRPCQYPTHALLYALNHARHIRALAPPGSLVLELGAGSGYLGALLVLMGYRYVASDIAQAFYLLQSHLLQRVAPEGCLNLLDERLGPDDLRALRPAQAAVVPWWRWVRREFPYALSIDVVTSNHNLLEMHPFSRLYHLSVVRDRLTENAVGLVFEGWGDPSKTPTWTAVQALEQKGFVLAHSDRRINCFPPASSPHAREGVLRYPLPLPQSPDPSANPYELHYAVPEFSDARNPLSKAILGMRAQESARNSRGIEDYRKLMGRADLATEDERFLAYIFRDTPAARPWIDVSPPK